MKRGLFYLILTLSFSFVSVYGFQWPVEDVVIVSTFGESEFNQYVNGVDIGGRSQDVKPIDAGELVFYSRPGASSLDLPSGLGVYVIYQHNNGIRSLYGHLENGSVNADQQLVNLYDTIGRMGATGSAIGTMLHLQVIDTEFGKYINPLLSLPLLIDGSKPLINEVYLFYLYEVITFAYQHPFLHHKPVQEPAYLRFENGFAAFHSIPLKTTERDLLMYK